MLLEVMRDLLYQTFVRKARLMQAMTFRKFIVARPGRSGYTGVPTAQPYVTT